MRILLTNDDGIESPGLTLLREALSAEHEVWVVAPASERSACSQSLSIHRPVRLVERGEHAFAADGTPADCVLTALLCLVKEPVDLVISGINRGPNLGTDIHYSGTVGAARQGALMGKPSFALSVFDERGEYAFAGAARFAALEIPRLAGAWSDDHFVNINFPARAEPPYRIAVTFPSRRLYTDTFKTFRAPDNSLYFFLKGEKVTSQEEEGGDYSAVKAGLVSLSPLPAYPDAFGDGEAYRRLLALRERVRP